MWFLILLDDKELLQLVIRDLETQLKDFKIGLKDMRFCYYKGSIICWLLFLSGFILICFNGTKMLENYFNFAIYICFIITFLTLYKIKEKDTEVALMSLYSHEIRSDIKILKRQIKDFKNMIKELKLQKELDSTYKVMLIHHYNINFKNYENFSN